MTKYIEADKAEIILEHILETDTRTFFNRGNELTDKVYSFVTKGLETLKSLPAADVQKVRHGHWIDGKCSVCGEHALYWLMSSGYYSSPYCPNCGALMVNEDE